MRDTPVTSIEIPQSTLVVPKDRDINISRVLRHKDSRIISWCIISWCADVLLHPCHHLRDLLHINCWGMILPLRLFTLDECQNPTTEDILHLVISICDELPLPSPCAEVCRQLGPISRPLASRLRNQICNGLQKGNDRSVDTGFGRSVLSFISNHLLLLNSGNPEQFFVSSPR